MTDAWLPLDEEAHRQWADAADWVRGGDEGRRFRQEVADAFDDARTWVDPSGYRLSDRIWNARETDRRAIDGVLRQMIANGTDSIEAAKQVEAYLLPTARNTTVTPRGGRGMYSARRLTRTEMTRAYGAATIRSADANPFVQGIKWNLSGRHPEPDGCDPNAGEDQFGMGEGVYPPDQVPRYPAHPHCFPVGTPVTTTDGLVAIEAVRVGQEVLTHEGRGRRVTGMHWRDHDGPMVSIRWDEGELLASPEHPVLTQRGWVEAACLQPGDHLCRASGGVRHDAFVGEVQNLPSRLAQFLVAHGIGAVRVPSHAVALHDETGGGDHEVGPAATNAVAVLGGHASVAQRTLHDPLDVPQLRPFLEVGHVSILPRWTGRLWNLEVAEDHTYAVAGVVVHNCLCTLSQVTVDDEEALAAIIQEMRDARGTADPARIAALTADAEAAAERLIRLRVAKAAQAEAERLHGAAMRQAAQTAAKSGGRAEAAWQNAWDFNLKATAEADAAKAALTAAKKSVKGIKDLPAARAAARTAAEDAARQAALKVAGQAAKAIRVDDLADDLYNAAAGQVRRFAPDAIEAALRKDVKVPAKTAGRVVFRNAGVPTDVGSQAADRIIAARFDDILREEWDRAVEEALRAAAKAEATDAIAYITTSKAVKRAEDIVAAVVQAAVDEATKALAAAAQKAAQKAAAKGGNAGGYGNVQQRLIANGYDPNWGTYDGQRDAFESAWDDAQKRHDRTVFRSLTPDQQAAVKIYKGSGYQEINKALRGKGGIGIDDRVDRHFYGSLHGYDGSRTFRQLANDLDDALASSASIQDSVIFRGTTSRSGEAAYAQLQPGDQFTERGYFSAATAKSSSWGGAIKWEIYIPKGMPGMQIDVTGINSSEREFLTPEGIEYRIISNTVANGERRIVAEMLPWKRRVR